jgi:predicted nucleic acid-binding protein
MSRYLLDACALLSFLLDEKEASSVEKILVQAKNGEVKLFMSLINYGEVCVRLEQFFDTVKAEEIKDDIKNMLDLNLLEASLEIVELAAKYKASGGLAYPDAIALATCKLQGLVLVTKDPEFRKFETEIAVNWL